MPTTRRSFLAQSAMAGAALAASTRSVRAQTTPPPLRVAFVGTGGICSRHLNDAERLGCICPCYADVDSRHHKNAGKKWPEAKAYTDYRQMLEKEHRNIDAVMVGTPDHHHYPATMMAMQLGKHAFTQKPLTHTPWEARQLLLAQEKFKVATQMGNHGHANEGNRVIVETIRSGMLGEVKEIHAWTNRPVWPQGLNRPEGEDPIPPELAWDTWLGPAPVRPFKHTPSNKRGGVYHQFNWRGWWDFGGGALADMACHTIDGVFWAMDPGPPTAVDLVTASPINQETYPNQSVVKFEFPARNGRPAFPLFWYDGGLMPPRPPELEADLNLPGTGNLVIGTKATLLVAGDYGDSPRIIPETKRREMGRPAKTIERSPGHMEEWVAACQGTKPYDYPGSNFKYAAALSGVVLLGNVALRTQKRLEWDSKNLRFTNNEDANQWVTKTYREGWKFEM